MAKLSLKEIRKNPDLIEIESVGDLIRRERIRKGITQKELAKMIYITQSWLSKIEDGNGEPDLIEGLRILTILNIPIKTIKKLFF